ncbi:MAG: SLOG family protein, partial [Defluviitaleaceae bacterium]|nr:SLOG family protein [Defluviitaleaceae bacterium]
FGHIRLICVIPHKGQEAAWNRRWRGRFNEVLIHADDHEYLHDEYITGCFHERNRVLVNSCQRLICFDSGRAGGTRHTVEYAQEQGVEIVNIWEEAEVWA